MGHVTLCVREIDYSELMFLAVVVALSAQCAAVARSKSDYCVSRLINSRSNFVFIPFVSCPHILERFS